jgi:LDH2 family malate/lactate/ureidoglycolate dehydrogenase
MSSHELAADALVRAVADCFLAAGIPAADAAIVAEDLVAADLEGVASHGVMLVPMYIERIRSGSVSKLSRGDVVSDLDASVVIDAGHALGQLTARQAVEIAIERARQFGMATVAVRNAFHFGTAGRYARMLADEGCVGMVMSNTRPLMPVTGGAEPLVGNNPIAIAVPSAGEFAPEVDMAMSAAAMGKIRNAAGAGQSIPEGWAADREGSPTTDPKSAIEGMLLPAAGPKGFGLAFIIDLLAGGLSGGSMGADVRPLYGKLDDPYQCSNVFIAIDVGHFVPRSQFEQRAKSEQDRVSASRRAPGVERVYAPGEFAYAARERAGGRVKLSAAAYNSLIDAGTALGLDLRSYI